MLTEAVDMNDLDTLARLLPTPEHLRLLQGAHNDLLGNQIKQLTAYFRTTLVKNISEALYNQKTKSAHFFSWKFPKEFTLPTWAAHFHGDSITPAMTASRHELAEILRRAGYIVSYVTNNNAHYEILITWEQKTPQL